MIAAFACSYLDSPTPSFKERRIFASILAWFFYDQKFLTACFTSKLKNEFKLGFQWEPKALNEASKMFKDVFEDNPFAISTAPQDVILFHAMKNAMRTWLNDKRSLIEVLILSSKLFLERSRNFNLSLYLVAEIISRAFEFPIWLPKSLTYFKGTYGILSITSASNW